MKDENARLTHMLAAEYVLGTLVGRARHRFERLLQARADLRRELQFWEARFAPLLASSKPIPPREIVWAEIEARINHPTVTPIKAVASAAPRSLWQTWAVAASAARSEEHTSELQSLMRISYAVFCLKKKKKNKIITRQQYNSSIIN